MKTILLWIPLFFFMVMPVSALDLEAPEVPAEAESWMPDGPDSFIGGLLELGEKGLQFVNDEFRSAASVCMTIIAAAMLLFLISYFIKKENRIINIAETTVISIILLESSDSLIRMASMTIQKLLDYGKLLFPVMTTAMAAQGRVSTSAALHTGTVVFNIIIGSLMSGIAVPAVYLFLAMSIGYGATGEPLLKRLRDMIKGSVSWFMKVLLTAFTTYMSITGVVSGSTDAAALKAAKLTISTAVPVVGGILSEASESVLISAELMKNAAGVYGILAFLALFMEPFLRIAVQYLTLKITAMLCCVFGDGTFTAITEDFSAAMGLLLAMTGSACLLQLISTVCYMRGSA